MANIYKTTSGALSSSYVLASGDIILVEDKGYYYEGDGSTAISSLTKHLSSDTVRISSIDNAGILELHRDDNTPTDYNQLGQVSFIGQNDNSEDIVYSYISTSASDVSDATEDGNFQIVKMCEGTQRNVFFSGTSYSGVYGPNSKGLQVNTNGLVTSTETNYESLVSGDDDFVTKKWVTDNVSSSTLTVGTVEPSTPSVGDIWIDTN